MPKGSVLVVDDDVDTLSVLSRLLETSDFKVIPAIDHVTAFELIELHHPDLVLIDLIMPQMTGIEFVRILRENPEFRDLPVVAMSCYDTNYLVGALLAGANSALHKPEDLDCLVETIDQLIGNRSSRVAV